MRAKTNRAALLAAAPASVRARNGQPSGAAGPLPPPPVAPPAPAERQGRGSARPVTPRALPGALDAAAGVVVVGLDPGLAALGWGVVRRVGSQRVHVAHGAMTTAPADGSDHARVAALAVSLRLLLGLHRPAVVAVERWVVYGQSETTQAHTIGLVLGMIVAVCAGEGVRVASTHRAQDWRRALGLAATATKAEAQVRVALALGMQAMPRPQHAADALAVAMVAVDVGESESEGMR